MKKVAYFGLLFILVTLFAMTVYGADFFLYDWETNKTLYMGTKDATFSERIQMDKKPELMMPTSESKKFLAAFFPNTDPWTGRGFTLFKPKKYLDKEPGKLVLYNIDTGRTEDLIELGYAPFTWKYTEDRKQIFVVYRTVLDDLNAPLELLHYDLITQKSEKATLPPHIKTVNQIILNPEVKKLYILGDNVLFHMKALWIGKSKPVTSGTPELITFNYSPLNSGESIPLDYTPLGFYLLSKDRGVLLAQNYKLIPPDLMDCKEGVIKYFDLQNNNVIEEQPVEFGRILTHWLEKEKILTVVCFQKKIGNILKITAEGLKKNQIEGGYNVCDYEYFPDKDSFYLLTDEEIRVIDYKTNAITNYDTDSNWAKKMPYSIYRIPDSDLAVLYCFEGGKVKFFDLKENKLISKVSCGRTGVKMFNSFASSVLNLDKSADTVVTTDPEQANYYIFNRITNDITVYDRSFQSKTYIALPEKGLGMYMIKKPVLQTIIITDKNIYQLDYTGQTLKPICEFTEKAESMFLFEDQNRIILTTDRELFVLDSFTLNVNYRACYFADKKKEYGKVKPGEQRYDFILTL